MTRYEAFIGKDWRDSGMTPLMVARIRSEGRAEVAFFLLDLWCLGVKDAFLADVATESEFREIVAERLPEEYRERFHPSCAKKMIEGAIAYAESFGFAPHRDSRKARRVLGGLDASDCPETFTFGQKGKPHYVAGPDDTPERIDRVLAMLEARCGKDGFHYTVAVDNANSDADVAGEEIDAEDARGSLVMFFDDEPESAPTFFELSGMITALQICPTVVSPTQLMENFWGPAGRRWRDGEDLNDFVDDLHVYWNYLASIVAECAAAPEPDAESDPIDLFEEDFENPNDVKEGINLWARGFMRATREWPEAWSAALQRADLAPHWGLVKAWSEPGKLASIAAIAMYRPPDPAADRSRHLQLAVIALSRALRPGSSADDTDG